MSQWLLLRGLTRETRHWDTFPALFGSELAAGQAEGGMTLLELPGNGVEVARQAPLSVLAMLAQVRSGAAALGLREPYRILAMSLGGMVATAWAQHYPHEVERLVLVNTSMQPFCRLTERLRPSAWPALAQIVLSWRNPAVCERLIHTYTCNRRDTLDADLAAWAAIRRTAPVSAANGLRQLWAAARFQAEPEAPRCPTLLLSSNLDRLVNPVCSAQIAAQWGVMHVAHPWAGHDLPHDDPGWTSNTIAAWLRSLV